MNLCYSFLNDIYNWHRSFDVQFWSNGGPPYLKITIDLQGFQQRPLSPGWEAAADHGDGGGGERRLQHRRRDRQLHADPYVEKAPDIRKRRFILRLNQKERRLGIEKELCIDDLQSYVN